MDCEGCRTIPLLQARIAHLEEQNRALRGKLEECQRGRLDNETTHPGW
jgi:FtsZ-binding cell division protein ZapB